MTLPRNDKAQTAVPAARIASVVLWALGLALGAVACGDDDDSAPADDSGVGPVAGSGQTAGSGQSGSGRPDMGGPGAQEPPPDAEGGQSGDPGSGPSECSGERWDGPQAPWIRARCTPLAEGKFSCACTEQDPDAVDKNANEATGTRAIGSESFVSGCRAALRDQCEIDPDASVFCGLAGVGTCWPSEDGDWSCECGEGVQHRPMSDSACHRALWEQCGDRCETPFGACGEVDDEQYRCQCTGVDGPTPRDPEPPRMLPDGSIAGVAGTPDGPPSCAQAMETYCGERCETRAGRCEPGDEGFSCSCRAGGSATQSFADLGGISPAACRNALQRSCGEELNAPLATCTQPTAKCEAKPRVWPPGEPRPDDYDYACRCDGGAAVTVAARTCYRAMMEACPAAIEQSALLAPAASGQVGALCSQDEDCAGGICHIGRLQREGVCSASCAADRDCPAGAVCAFEQRGDAKGRCFFECEREYGCERLNDAIDDPLLCADPAFLPYGRLLRDDESGELCAPISDQYRSLPVQR